MAAKSAINGAIGLSFKFVILGAYVIILTILPTTLM